MSEVRCWLCKDGKMHYNHDDEIYAAWYKCDVCGSYATVATVARHREYTKPKKDKKPQEQLPLL